MRRLGCLAALCVSLGALVGCTWQEPINTDRGRPLDDDRGTSPGGGGTGGAGGKAGASAQGELSEGAFVGLGSETLRDLVVRDLNGDGAPDLLLLTVDEGTTESAAMLVSVLNDGKGGFRKLVAYKTNEVPVLGRRLAVADLDGDQRLDVVILGSKAGGFAVFKGQGDGSFRPDGGVSGGLDTVHDAWVLDYDSDGDPDVLSAGDENLALLRNDGLGALTAETLIESWGSAFCVFGQTDNITPIDAVAIASDGRILPFSRIAGEGFSEAAPAPSFLGRVVQAAGGDLNGDGFVDLVAYADLDRAAQVALGNGARSFAKPTAQTMWSAEPGLMASALGDLDGDGRLDAVTSSAAGLQIWPGKGDGTFGNPTRVATQSAPHRLVVADLNGDGQADLVTFGSRGGSNGVTALIAGARLAALARGVVDTASASPPPRRPIACRVVAPPPHHVEAHRRPTPQCRGARKRALLPPA